ncbi:transposase family protein [Streptomyces sp. NPDC048179]|uniref:transposase family protein n=1 Tax=Streptomyces sp. NPDC048179 TaxID=3365506 RepID=UPI0037127F47
MPADASSLTPPALDQLRDKSQAGPGEVPGLLERLAEAPDQRDPGGVRHRLAVVLALTECAVLAGATSLLAVGEWIADVVGHVLERVGADPDPLLPRRVLPAETTRSAGCWPASTATRWTGRSDTGPPTGRLFLGCLPAVDHRPELSGRRDD